MYIRTDVMGTKIHNTQRIVSDKVQESMKRLSTGLRINSASDDSSGLAISERLRASINQSQKEIQNTNDYINKSKLKDSSLGTITDILMRIRELTIQGNNGTLSDSDKTSILNEKIAMIDTINKIATSSTYNGKQVIDIESGVMLDGVRDYAKIDKNLLSPTMTLQFTVKPELNKIMHYLHASDISSGDGYGSENEINFSYSPSGIPFFLKTNNVTNVFLNGPSIPLDEWTNVSVVVNSVNRTASYFINGDLASQTAINGTIDFSNYQDYMLIGMSKSANMGRDYGGNIKDVSIYNRALTQEELNSNISGDKITDGLSGSWDFQQLGGKTVNDESGNNHSASLLGDATFYLDFDENSNLDEIDTAIEKISKLRTDNGSQIVSYEFDVDYLSNKQINESNAKSRIKDADLSSVSSELIKNQIKLQSSIQMLQKNNSNRESVLSLLLG